ncbi:hypothetical protein [Streptomyces omiyaensis]|uniref:hypothetical protein n=1 Tax=Streptomyces omiyaensis TaxID=68247 RepID=UPI0036F96334
MSARASANIGVAAIGRLEWKSRLDLTDRRSFFTITKAVLGFANRLPDRALRFADGHGYLLVGVEPGQAIGRLCQPVVVPVDLGVGLVNMLLVDVEPLRGETPSTSCTRATTP